MLDIVGQVREDQQGVFPDAQTWQAGENAGPAEASCPLYNMELTSTIVQHHIVSRGRNVGPLRYLEMS